MREFKAAAKWLALLALLGTITPPVLFAFRLLGESPMKWSMLAATLLWFGTAPFWLKGGES
jgi:hypothetical protein